MEDEEEGADDPLASAALSFASRLSGDTLGGSEEGLVLEVDFGGAVCAAGAGAGAAAVAEPPTPGGSEL
jgi:hypothetical protein